MTKELVELLRSATIFQDRHRLELIFESEAFADAAAEQIERLDAVEPEARQPDAATPVPQQRLYAIARSFVAALEKEDPNYNVDMSWNEGVSIINELMNARRALNREGGHE